MLFDIPNELIPYVRISKKQGLVCSEDLPEELMPVFEKAKKEYAEKEATRIAELQQLLVNTDKGQD